MRTRASAILAVGLATLFLAGLADSIGQALGGGFAQGVIGWLVILGGISKTSTRTAGHPAAAWRPLLLLAGLAIVLPYLCPWIADFLAGPLVSWTTVGSFLLFRLLLTPPLSQLGEILAQKIEAKSLWLWWIGGVLGLAIAHRFGIGPTRFLLLTGLLALFLAQKGTAEKSPTEGNSGAEGFLIPFAGFLAYFWLQPWLGLFDPGGSPQEFRRILTWGFLVLLGMSTLGSSRNPLMAGLYCSILAASIGLAAKSAGIPQEVSTSTAWLKFLGISAAPDMVGHSLYVPWGVLLVAGLPAIAFGAAWGAHRGMDFSIQDRRLALLAAGGALFIAHALPRVGMLTVIAAAAAGCISIFRYGTMRYSLAQGWKRIVLTCWPVFAIPLVLVLMAPLPKSPEGFARPQGVFKFKVFPQSNGDTTEITDQGSVIRVLERDSAKELGKRFLAQGNFLLTPDSRGEAEQRYDALFALGLQGLPRKVLLVGAPHAGTFEELKLSGVQEIHLACDPKSLWDTSKHLPEWANLSPDAIATTIPESEGQFDLILLRDRTPWQRNANLLRPHIFATAKRKLARDGAFAILLNPTTTGQGAVGGIQRWMKEHFPHHGVWILPRNLRTPAILIAGGFLPLGENLAPRIKAGLVSRGLPVGDSNDIGLMRIKSFDCQSGRLRAPMHAPFARLPALLKTWPSEKEGAASLYRAAKVLDAMKQDCSAPEEWLDFHIAQLESQVWNAQDLFFAEDYAQIEISEDALQSMLSLGRRSPDSSLLRALGGEIASILGPQREIEWIQTYLLPLAEDLGWRSLKILLALGKADLELLEPEKALAWANEALVLAPANQEALGLKEQAKNALQDL